MESLTRQITRNEDQDPQTKDLSTEEARVEADPEKGDFQHQISNQDQTQDQGNMKQEVP